MVYKWVRGRTSARGLPVLIYIYFKTIPLLKPRDRVMQAWNNIKHQTVAIEQIFTFKWLFSFGIAVVADEVPCCFNSLD